MATMRQMLANVLHYIKLSQQPMRISGQLSYVAVWTQLCAIQRWYDLGFQGQGHSIRIN